MASQTQVHTIQRRFVAQESRNHDYLYDPIYHVSSQRDHARVSYMANSNNNRLLRVPVFPTMFSDLRHCPRYEIRIDSKDPVPNTIQRQWQGHAEQARDALQLYKKIHYNPAIQIPPKQHPFTDATGRDRAKFFRRPIVSFMPQVPSDVILATSRQDTFFSPSNMAKRANRSQEAMTFAKSVATQTDYRDGETQTDPYSPEYVVRPGSAPELLTLATLSWNCGLPAGQAEVEMIERARAKRAWEATLPPLHDASQHDKRRRMMDAQERREWAYREQEIERLQEIRLQLLVKLLKQREENHEELNAKRLDRRWAKNQQEKEERFQHLRFEHIKALRKLMKGRSNVEHKLHRRDIISEYANPGSETFAPLMRMGVFIDRGSEKYVVRSKYLDTYEGLQELESTLPLYVIHPRIKAPKPQTVTKDGFVKRKFRQENELAELHQYIRKLNRDPVEVKKPLRFLEKVVRPEPRPPTPTIESEEGVNEEQNSKELCLILLQQLIRGRAIQAMMHEGKEKRKELIQELRSTHALQEAQMNEKMNERQVILNMQRQRRLLEHREAFVEEALADLEGESLGDTMDFLSKELIRLQEERRIHAFAMLAERQRRLREAEESGRRQVEERRRREEDEVFKQMMKVHQMSVDQYLETVINDTMESTAAEFSSIEIQDIANKINDAAYAVETSRDELQSEEIVADLVHHFVIPEVNKKVFREKMALDQRKYLLAAHEEIKSKSQVIIPLRKEAEPIDNDARSESGSQTPYVLRSANDFED